VSGARAARGAAVLNVLCAFAGFALGAAAIRPLVPWPSELGLRAKFEHFAAHRDEYDAVVFGSSFTQYGIKPAALDAAFAEQGLPQRSFNLAVAGMNAYEQDHVVRSVLALEPARLSRIYVEAVSWTAPDDNWVEGEFHARAINWHTPRETLAVLRQVWSEPDYGTAERVRRSGVHLRLLLQRLVNHAQGPAIVAALLGTDDPHAYLEPENLLAQGYRKLDIADGPEFVKRRQYFVSHLKEYATRVAQVEAHNRVDNGSANLAAVRAQRDRLLATGARVLWFVPPTDGGAGEFYALERNGTLPDLLGFNWPSRYGDLYRPDHHFDRGHLNERGAELWSRLFAEKAAPRLRAPAAGPGAPGAAPAAGGAGGR
jgi:hypothetical protein